MSDFLNKESSRYKTIRQAILDELNEMSKIMESNPKLEFNDPVLKEAFVGTDFVEAVKEIDKGTEVGHALFENLLLSIVWDFFFVNEEVED